jgi:hypothetical protein
MSTLARPLLAEGRRDEWPRVLPSYSFALSSVINGCAVALLALSASRAHEAATDGATDSVGSCCRRCATSLASSKIKMTCQALAWSCPCSVSSALVPVSASMWFFGGFVSFQLVPFAFWCLELANVFKFVRGARALLHQIDKPRQSVASTRTSDRDLSNDKEEQFKRRMGRLVLCAAICSSVMPLRRPRDAGRVDAARVGPLAGDARMRDGRAQGARPARHRARQGRGHGRAGRRGYPGAYAKGARNSGCSTAEMVPGVKVFQAGTACDAAGALTTAGGRVLAVSAVGAMLHKKITRSITELQIAAQSASLPMRLLNCSSPFGAAVRASLTHSQVQGTRTQKARAGS